MLPGIFFLLSRSRLLFADFREVDLVHSGKKKRSCDYGPSISSISKW